MYPEDNKTSEELRELESMMRAYGEEYPGAYDSHRDTLVAHGKSREEVIRDHGDWSRAVSTY